MRPLLLPLLALLILAAACGADGDTDAEIDSERPTSPDTVAVAPGEPSSATTQAPPTSANTETTDSTEAEAEADSPTTTPDSQAVDQTDAPTPTTSAPSATDPGPATADQVAAAATGLALEPLAGFEQPLDLVWDTAGAGPYVAEKTGRLYRLDPTTGQSELVIDLSAQISTDSERGLLGAAFDPAGAWLYLSSTTTGGDSVITAWGLGSGFPLDPAAGVELMRVPQPFSNHNGGDLAIGLDGHLYWALGDGGSAGDPENNGQDPATALGTIVRIDPQPESGGYAVPTDNPFVGNSGALDEIWLWGLRNPWKFSFDRLTGDLWIGDVGQNEVEEINLIPAGQSGGNLGWNCFEGDQSFAGCEVGGHVLPVSVYRHSLGNSVTGGYVYRGDDIGGLHGAYLFGDFGSGRVWALPTGTGEAIETSLSVGGLASFGEAPDGELWVAAIGGQVSRIVAG